MSDQVVKRVIGVVLSLMLALLGINEAHALDYVSVADSSAILYDANSIKSKKLFVVSRYTPLELVVNLKDWIKVRDSSGSLAWIERRSVSDKHYVVVTVPFATVRQAPDITAPVLYQVSKKVALESLGVNGGGWIKARHLDGTMGFVRSIEVWGED